MKKFILSTFSLILISLLISCNSKVSTIQKSIETFFSKNSSNEKVDILLIKEIDNEKLILAQKPGKDGEQSTNLFLLNENNKILSWTSGRKPISQCFTVNTLIYNNKRIIFGSFNDSKYIHSEDKKISVDISKINIILTDNKSICEDVSLDKGYLLVIDDTSDIQEVTVLNNGNEIQSTLRDIDNIIDKADFIKYKL
ncbi:hypothetical protein [Clostridium intestinale]|uniref:Lipoprotein n=1 Tax=Clostridium intestinale DSM 6191 TaxID=1121320 RepID=A0A1M5WBY8_9CLOT|nr:hypothetical protein [Clostridium intestinale]SHH85025.1 hypothetical protein SAMN02745941_01023 [Clostridium intestinale DSM 6191]